MANLETSSNAGANAVTDPVCRMEVYPGRTRLLSIYRGGTYWFCSEDCRTAFEMNPGKYLDAKGPRKKGWFRRHLERMAKINKAEFDAAGHECH
jgi:YHS domain-containing protein